MHSQWAAELGCRPRLQARVLFLGKGESAATSHPLPGTPYKETPREVCCILGLSP